MKFIKSVVLIFVLFLCTSLLYSCRSKEVVGPKGEQGIQGEMGPQGEQGIKGEPGEDGHTPEITIGENGNWYIDGIDTGVLAEGVNGEIGKSAYEIYVEAHPEYSKSESEWIDDLINGVLKSKCTVTFNSDGGTEIKSQSVCFGDRIEKPVDPIKKGYVFDGWYLAESFENGDIEKIDPWNFIYYTVSENMTLKAKWLKDDSLYFKSFISEDEWINAFNITNATINYDQNVVDGSENFIVNDIIIKVIDGHWFSNYLNENEWSCAHFVFTEYLDYSILYNEFKYNGDYCYYSRNDYEESCDIKIYFDEQKKIIKIEFNFVDKGLYSSIMNLSCDIYDYNVTETPSNIIFETYEKVIIEDNQEYYAEYCDECDTIIHSESRGSHEELSSFITREEWRELFSKNNYGMEFVVDNYYRQFNIINDNVIYENVVNNYCNCINKKYFNNLNYYFYSVIKDSYDIDFYPIEEYEKCKFNSEYCYTEIKNENIKMIIKIYFNNEKLIESLECSVEYFDYRPNENYKYIFSDYNNSITPIIKHNFSYVEHIYGDTLEAISYCNSCGEAVTTELDQSLSDAIKLLKNNVGWSYFSEELEDGKIYEHYYNYNNNSAYTRILNNDEITFEELDSQNGYIYYDYENMTVEYDFYPSITDYWANYTANFSNLIYENFEKFTLVENENFPSSEGWVTLLTYDDNLICNYFGMSIEEYFKINEISAIPSDPFNLTFCFKIEESVIVYPLVLFSTETTELWGIHYGYNRRFYSNEQFTNNFENIIEAYSVIEKKYQYYRDGNKTYTITWVNYDGTILETDYFVEYGTQPSFDGETPVRDLEKYIFVGWSPKLEPVEQDMVYYTKYKEIEVNITYELNGGNWQYSNREDMVDDFLNDALAWAGKTGKPVCMVDHTGSTIGFVDKFSTTIYEFFNHNTYGPKWNWLKEYIINVTEDPASKAQLINEIESYWRYSIGAFLFEDYHSSWPVTEDFTKYAAANGFWNMLSDFSQNVFKVNASGELLVPFRPYFNFLGWYDNSSFNGEPINNCNYLASLYAKWEEKNPVESISITNKITRIDRYDTYQLEWTIFPDTADIKDVKFSTSDSTIATIDDNGFIKTHNKGIVMITIESLNESLKKDTMILEVVVPGHFEVSYETNSYVFIGETIKLNAEYIDEDGDKYNIVFISLNPDLVETDSEGNVIALAEGLATVRAALEVDDTRYFDFVVTVLPDNLTEEELLIIESHESNIFTKYDLELLTYEDPSFVDIFGSVNKLLFNYNIDINTDYLSACMQNDNYSYGLQQIEFITIHSTETNNIDGMSLAKYYTQNNPMSSHYCVGDDGIYQTLELNNKAWHAGDGTLNNFVWTLTGVYHDENDPEYPVFGISDDSYFTINGKKTLVKVPARTNNGVDEYVTDSKYIPEEGLPFKIENGYYYIGTMRWQSGELTSHGGNSNSIAIDTALGLDTDLWLTWQITAKLTANLLVKYNLDVTRVVTHSFFSSSKCSRTLNDNNRLLWWEFIELVKSEYEALKKLGDYTIEMNVLDSEIIDEYGRIIQQDKYSQTVLYEVEITHGEFTKVIKLASIVPGNTSK